MREEIAMPKRDGKNNPGDRCRCLGEEAAAATAWGKRKVTKKGGKNRINKNKMIFVFLCIIS